MSIISEAFNRFMCFLHKGTQATGWRGVRRRKRHLQGGLGARLPRAKPGGGSRRPNKPGRHSLLGAGGEGRPTGCTASPSRFQGAACRQGPAPRASQRPQRARLLGLKAQGREMESAGSGDWMVEGARGTCQRWLLLSSPETTFLLFRSHPHWPFLSC